MLELFEKKHPIEKCPKMHKTKSNDPPPKLETPKLSNFDHFHFLLFWGVFLQQNNQLLSIFFYTQLRL